MKFQLVTWNDMEEMEYEMEFQNNFLSVYFVFSIKSSYRYCLQQNTTNYINLIRRYQNISMAS